MTPPKPCDRCAERTAQYLAMDGRRRLCRPCAAEDAAAQPRTEPSAEA